MAIAPYVSWMLAQEARALLTRLARVKPFALLEPMLPAANLLPEAQTAIESFLVRGRRELAARIQDFLFWLRGPGSFQADNEAAHRRFVFLRLRFNAVLNQFDLFNDVITQRSEHDTGVWLSGLDVASADLCLARGVLPSAACHLLPGPGHRGRHPARPHAASGRRREPGGHRPRA